MNDHLNLDGGSRAPMPVKIVVSGGFAVGKTTFVESISEIKTLRTEAVMTKVSEGIDETGGTNTGKTSTTVALDFGRITLSDEMVLYLFGTPGQERFQFMWDDISRGAVGAVVLVDTNRFEECFNAVDYFESSGVPFVVAVNMFHGDLRHELKVVRDALSIPEWVPVVATDARSHAHTKQVLIKLVKHALVMAHEREMEEQRAAAGHPSTGGHGSQPHVLGPGNVSAPVSQPAVIPEVTQPGVSSVSPFETAQPPDFSQPSSYADERGGQHVPGVHDGHYAYPQGDEGEGWRDTGHAPAPTPPTPPQQPAPPSPETQSSRKFNFPPPQGEPRT